MQINQKINFDSPIVLFDLEDLAIDKLNFFSEMKPVYIDLPWDYYDVRKEQYDFLFKKLPKKEEKFEEIFIPYYLGKLPIEVLDPYIASLNSLDQKKFFEIKPYRRRVISHFALDYKDGWDIKRIKIKNFEQKDIKQDYRQLPRQFSEASDILVSLNSFNKFIVGIGNIVKDLNKSVKYLQMIVHNTGVIATQDRMGKNSPEGIHQDGFDYIVSAFVVERNGIEGARSEIYGPNKHTKCLVKTLKEGEGILQRDRNSELWHTVTPFKKTSPALSYGTRNTIGVDINIIDKEEYDKMISNEYIA